MRGRQALADPVQAPDRRCGRRPHHSRSRVPGLDLSVGEFLYRLTPPWLSSAQVISDRGRRDPAFAHRVADLVEPVDDVSGGVEAGNAGALVGVAEEAAVLGELRAD